MTLGLPDQGRPAGAGRGLVWTYLTFGEHGVDKGFSTTTGRLEIVFVAGSTRRNNYAITGSMGRGIYPAYVLNAMEIARRAAVGEPRRRAS